MGTGKGGTVGFPHEMRTSRGGWGGQRERRSQSRRPLKAGTTSEMRRIETITKEARPFITRPPATAFPGKPLARQVRAEQSGYEAIGVPQGGRGVFNCGNARKGGFTNGLEREGQVKFKGINRRKRQLKSQIVWQIRRRGRAIYLNQFLDKELRDVVRGVRDVGRLRRGRGCDWH